MSADEVSAEFGVRVGQGRTVDFARNPMAEFAVYLSPLQVSLVDRGRGHGMPWDTVDDIRIETEGSRVFLVIRQRSSVTMLETSHGTAAQVRDAWKGRKKRGFWR